MSASFGDLAVFSYDCPAFAGRKDRVAGHFYWCLQSQIAPVDTGDLSIGSRFQSANGLETVRSRLQRLVDIGGAMRGGQEHIVLGMKECAVA
jgi:hypothetical protein